MCRLLFAPATSFSSRRVDHSVNCVVCTVAEDGEWQMDGGKECYNVLDGWMHYHRDGCEEKFVFVFIVLYNDKRINEVLLYNSDMTTTQSKSERDVCVLSSSNVPVLIYQV